MTTRTGLDGFTDSRIFSEYPVFNGVTLEGVPVPLEKRGGNPKHLFEAADGKVSVQLDYTDAARPVTTQNHSWAFTLSARTESVWWMFDLVDRSGAMVYFVPWDQETEPFTAGPQLTTFTLPRPFARDVLIDHPNVESYPILAWLDGTAQDVIFTGDPAAGEVKVSGLTVTTPGLTAGQVLVLRGVVAYPVVVAEFSPQQLAGGRVLTRQVVLTEAGGI